jgi:hypothetical protein
LRYQWTPSRRSSPARASKSAYLPKSNIARVAVLH